MTIRPRLLLISLLVLLASGCSSDPAAKLHRAAGNGQVKQVEQLLAEGAEVDRLLDGKTPLWYAVQRGQPRTASLLLEKGADIRTKGPGGEDLWDLVLGNRYQTYPSQGQGECLALLIDQGFEPRSTLLEVASRVDSQALVEAFLKSGADLEERDVNGWTALHHAAKNGKEATCEALLKAGADPNAESTRTIEESIRNDEGTEQVVLRFQKGTRPADVADLSGSKGVKSCAQLIQEHGGSRNEKLDNKR